jgi:proline dehydrogenase
VVADDRLDASLSVKFSSLGSGFDRALSRKTVLALAEAAAERKIGFEIDMEGRGLVEYTVGTAIAAAEAGYPPTLAVQAYLDRSVADLSRLIPHGIRPRIVKGTYGGDTEDFAAVQARFQALAEFLGGRGAAFSAGTHDPDLIRWLQQRFVGSRERVEFGFLLGLADAAKRELAASGWRVAEYVPFGETAKGYETRRLRYLETLAAIHREPAP